MSWFRVTWNLVAWASARETVAVALEVVPEDWSTRLSMLSSALVLIVIGNSLPKKVEPGSSRTRGLRIQRLLGYTFVLTGLTATPIWLFAPIDDARFAGLSLYGVAVAFSLFAVTRINPTPTSSCDCSFSCVAATLRTPACRFAQPSPLTTMKSAATRLTWSTAGGAASPTSRDRQSAEALPVASPCCCGQAFTEIARHGLGTPRKAFHGQAGECEPGVDRRAVFKPNTCFTLINVVARQPCLPPLRLF